MQNYGKEKCRILKKIRAEIAKQNEIEWVTEECRHKGSCRGTCPKCEAEVRQLEAELDKRRSLGKTIVVAGVAAGLAVTMASCNPETAEQTPGSGSGQKTETFEEMGQITAEQSAVDETTDILVPELMGDIVEPVPGGIESPET